ncbi:MAG: DUF4390 domain-containing protein [Rhodoferax sp.]|nr:DUF4390 domain-containing protein [Rhodoferax sp.]MBK9235301.1 DUF4390 domain-containing protein [Rhodoferax sp.]
MTAFTTLCWRSAALDALRLTLVLLLSWTVTLSALAQSAAEVTQLRLERDGESVLLSAVVQFDLSPTVEEALVKGVPMIFVAEFELYRERWYWTNKKVLAAQRHMRLAYQPLTRRWRLHVASGPLSSAGLGLSLNQSFETMADAVAAMQRLSRWKVAELTDIDPEQSHHAEFRFKLDLAQLPRPFQIGSLGQADWNISASKTQRLALEPAK